MLARLLQRAVSALLLLLVASLCLASPMQQTPVSPAPGLRIERQGARLDLRLAIATLGLAGYGSEIERGSLESSGPAGDPDFDRRHRNTALTIQQILHFPAVVALQGVHDEAALSSLANAASAPETGYRAYMDPSIGAGTLHLGYLVNTGVLQVRRVQTMQASDLWCADACGASEPLWQDPPLTLEVSLRDADRFALPWVFINVHLASCEGVMDEQGLENSKARRHQQIMALATLVHSYQSHGKEVVVLGDFETASGKDATSAATREAVADESRLGLSDLALTLSARDDESVGSAGPAMQERIFTPAGVDAELYQPQMHAFANAPVGASATTPAGASRYDGQLATISLPIKRLSAMDSRFNGSFGEQAVGSTSRPQMYGITANQANLAPVNFGTPALLGQNSTDFNVSENTCTRLNPGERCTLTLTFAPAALGTRSATLSVPNDSGNNPAFRLPLSGTGTTAIVIDSSPLDFGSQDVGFSSAAKQVRIRNLSDAPLPLPTFRVSAPDWTVISDCGPALPARSTCLLSVIFTPASAGHRSGELQSADAALLSPVSLTGNGVDFSLTDRSESGVAVAGRPASMTAQLTSLGGFQGVVSLSCTTSAPASTCEPQIRSTMLTDRTAVPVTIRTSSRYLVVGYEGATPQLAVAAGLLLTTVFIVSLRSRTPLLRLAVCGFFSLAVAGSILGCGSSSPPQRAAYTPPGRYEYRITASDGVLTRVATYSLAVTSH